LIVSGLLLGLNVLNDRVLLPRRARRFVSQQKSIQGEISIGWDAEGVVFGQSRTAWDDYFKWLENESLVLPERAARRGRDLALLGHTKGPVSHDLSATVEGERVTGFDYLASTKGASEVTSCSLAPEGQPVVGRTGAPASR
jgi:hypothetical protein